MVNCAILSKLLTTNMQRRHTSILESKIAKKLSIYQNQSRVKRRHKRWSCKSRAKIISRQQLKGLAQPLRQIKKDPNFWIKIWECHKEHLLINHNNLSSNFIHNQRPTRIFLPNKPLTLSKQQLNSLRLIPSQENNSWTHKIIQPQRLSLFFPPNRYKNRNLLKIHVKFKDKRPKVEPSRLQADNSMGWCRLLLTREILVTLPPL